MKNYDYDLGIIGGGAAGLTAAAGSAQFGAKTILIEKSDRLGGDCLHTGCVPSKTLIRTAGVYALAKEFPEFGLGPINIPTVDLGLVMDRVHKVIEKIQKHDSPERFCSLGAEVRFGTPVFTDDHTAKLDGKGITARSWIIATGSHPALPPVVGLEQIPYWTNETVFQQRDLPKSLIVLGGGPIGLELAQAFGRLGSKVTVIEYMDQILGPEDADIAEILKQRLLEEGVDIMTRARAVSAGYSGGVVSLRIAPVNAEGLETVIKADAILVAAGRKPNTEGLGLEKAGVEYSVRGIQTDNRMRTNVKHIYACGDVNGLMPFTHVAGYEAGIALTNAILRLPRKSDYSKIGWCTYTAPAVASIGYNEKRALKDGIEYRIFEEEFQDNDRALAENETSGKIKLLLSGKGKAIGCQIIGAHADEMIHEWVVALNSDVKLSTIAGSVHVYPTLSEISKRVAGKVFSEKIFSKRSRDILHFLFNLKGQACNLPEHGNDS
jgi:pyruvate/2-oxoglutarate dehydrogenase complex dihydrolipoamide dehydrogenase (E3) component